MPVTAANVRVGTVIPPWELASVSAEKMKILAALLGDSNPIHFDVAAVRAVGLGDRPVNQGPSNMAYVMNMLADWAGGYDRVRSLRLRFLANVFAGDMVSARGVVSGVREEAGRTVVECDVRLEVEGRGEALVGVASVLVPAA